MAARKRTTVLLQALRSATMLPDPMTLAVVSTLVEPGFRANLVQRGLTEQQAVDETVRLVLAWLAQRPT